MRHVHLASKRYLTAGASAAAMLAAAMAMFGTAAFARYFFFALFLILLAGNCLRNRMSHLRLREKAAGLLRSIDLLETAEGLAGIGRWCIEIEPRRHLWSEEMCHLAGLPAGTPPREEMLRRTIPEGMAQMDVVLAAHATDQQPFVVEFEVLDRGKGSRVLRARAQNVLSASGIRQQVFMVVRDVSDDYALKRDRDEAIRLAERARHDANTDELTGLSNRRHTMAELDRAVIEARAHDMPLSLIVFDIDHFKEVNDRHGHPVGDKVIAKVGQIAARQAHEMDIVGRIGGEEFLWILPACDTRAAIDAADRLRWAIEAGTRSATLPSITISAGHAVIEHSDTSLLLFSRADAALYEAKRAGRNRVAQAA